jgi:hypothetical protein
MLVGVPETYATLSAHHYLGPTKSAGFAWRDDLGVIVFAAPRARGVPSQWIEVVRWCLTGPKNSGSQQWARAVKMLRHVRPDCTTVISYSDPSQGHTGALYRACNWLWAPTWLRLRPPPTGNGSWRPEKRQEPKDRWIFPLAPDDTRQGRLSVNDESLMRRVPWASYTEPRWRGGRFDPTTGGGDYKRWISENRQSN